MVSPAKPHRKSGINTIPFCCSSIENRDDNHTIRLSYVALSTLIPHVGFIAGNRIKSPDKLLPRRLTARYPLDLSRILRNGRIHELVRRFQRGERPHSKSVEKSPFFSAERARSLAWASKNSWLFPT